ncbi:MAG: hypothetical protein N2554_11910 [Fimbriimonadales bacterium]|nr:hypothetical protein [Fimbriimonadales bacterium]
MVNDPRADTHDGTGRNVRATQRGWVWAGFMLGLTARMLGASALFWAAFPLWLSVFWSLQGYPPTLADLPRWYAVGAFNAVPVVATALISPLVAGMLFLAGRRRDADTTPKRFRGVGVVPTILGAFLYALLVPPVAYALLLVYAEMWQYRAWDTMTPTLLRAYLLLAPVGGAVGALIGWSMKRK